MSSRGYSALRSLNTLRTLAFVLLALAATALAAAPQFPPLTGRIVDNAGLLDSDTERRLTALLEAHETRTGNQIVVATLPDLQGYEISDFGYQLGRAWGIGQEGRDNGALLIVARDERKLRIEVGYGLEGTLTDALASDIIRNTITPHFRQQDFDAGISAGVTRILAILDGDPVAQTLAKPASSEEAPAWVIWLFVIIVIAFILISVFGGNRHAGNSVGGFGGFGGGASGGGGFSGGGGSFGGGGASGDW